MSFSERHLSVTSSLSRRDCWRAVAAATTGTLALRSTWAQSPAARGSSSPSPAATPQSDDAARRGATWLVRTLPGDAGWGTDAGQPPDIGCTALAGLALLSAGNTPREGPLAREVRQAAQYLLGCVDRMPADDITASQQTQLQNKVGRRVHTFLAAMFLSQVLGESSDGARVRRALRRLIDVIVVHQTPEGHWGQNAWAPTLGTVLGWVALRGAYFAGLEVGASPDATARHLERQLQATLGGAAGSWMHALYKNATSIRVLHALGQGDQPAAQLALAETLKLISTDNTAFAQAGGEEYLAFHLITETLLQRGGDDWRAWYPVVRDKIVGVQNDDGSWSGAHCITSRTFCTSAALIVLQAPHRFLPLSQI